ncbi:oligosaccharide flippase family protein [Candidatus Woesearchaeota archaeon]|nr:oligosaccharide flippase family protein [Candidatus Woesearchaeota archaeon]
MIKKIKFHLKKNEALIKDNLILFFAIGTANVLNYFFRFFVGRSLGPEEFGVFEVLLSLIYVIVIPLTAIQTTLSKFVAEFKVKNEDKKIAYLFSKSIKKIGLVGLMVALIFLAVSPILASFLKIEELSPLIIIGVFMTFTFLIPVLRGFLQGLQRFKLLGSTFIVESLIKIGFGIPLIYWGFGVNGAIWGFMLGFFLPFLIIFYFVSRLFRSAKEKFESSNIYKYSFPVLIMLVSLTIFYTLDLILVKRFFDPITAGYYAALSLFGKVIFFASMSISIVMFPKVSELNSQNKNTRSLLFKSLLITLILGAIGSLFYYLTPDLVVNLLFGKEYLIIAPLLGFFGIIMTIYSLSYVIAYYNIALQRLKFLYLLGSFNILELILIYLFHKTILQVMISLIIVMVLLFLSLIVYTVKNDKSFNNYPGIQ